MHKSLVYNYILLTDSELSNQPYIYVQRNYNGHGLHHWYKSLGLISHWSGKALFNSSNFLQVCFRKARVDFSGERDAAPRNSSICFKL